MVETVFGAAPRTRRTSSALLEAMSRTADGVYAVDETHRIMMWNAAASRILGYSADEVLGKLCFELVGGRDDKGNLVCQGGCADMALAKAGAVVPTRNLQVRTKDGAPVWLNVTNVPVPSDHGGLSTVIHIFREVTAQRNTEQLVQRLSALMESFASSQAARLMDAQEPPARHESLTSRERQVVRLLAEGSNAPSIAQALVISPATVRKHVQNILKKLGVHTALEAVAYCSRHNLLSSPSD